jgi:hypothetical protein
VGGLCRLLSVFIKMEDKKMGCMYLFYFSHSGSIVT